VQVEVHVSVDKKISIEKAHGIGKEVEKKVEGLAEIDEVFVHIDPV